MNGITNLNESQLNELITLCKSEFLKLIEKEKMSNSKKTYMQLIEIIQEANKLIESTIEEPRNTNKFMFVSGRDSKNSKAEITVCNPELVLTILNQDTDLNILQTTLNKFTASQVELSSGLFLYNSSTDSSDSTRSMRRSQAKINLLTKNQSALMNSSEGDSVISTAEEHQITKLSVEHDIKKLKPKSQSSTTSLLKLIKNFPILKQSEDKSITFNVDIASTPKKFIQRSSTPKRLTLQKVRNHPLTSTLIKSDCKKYQKKIPPPLLSSSSINDLELKRKRSGSIVKKEKEMKKLKLVCRQKSKCCNCKKSKEMRKMSEKNLKNLKYPIKYCPNLKLKDIDRVQLNDDVNCLGYENNLKPVLKNCYSYGDYNVWFL